MDPKPDGETRALTPAEPSKGGAPKGNTNALRHGLYSARAKELTSRKARRQADTFRRSLEAAALQVYGEAVEQPDGSTVHCLPVEIAVLVHGATEANRIANANRERLALLLERGEEPAPDLWLRFDEAYQKALDRRDAKVRQLELSREQLEDPLETLYGKQPDPVIELYGPPPSTEPPTLGDGSQGRTSYVEPDDTQPKNEEQEQ